MTSTDWKCARCVFSRMECFAPPSRNSCPGQFVRVTHVSASLGERMQAIEDRLEKPSACRAPVMKTILKKPSACRVPAFSHLSPLGEDDVLRRRAAGDSPTEMAEVLDRDLSSVVHHVQRLESPERAQPKPVGRPAALTAKQVDLFARNAILLAPAACASDVSPSCPRAPPRLLSPCSSFGPCQNARLQCLERQQKGVRD